MDNLSLLYEKQNLPITTIRHGILNQIRIAEAHNNTNRVLELATVLNDAEIAVLITEGIWDGVKRAASEIGQQYQSGKLLQQKKEFCPTN